MAKPIQEEYLFSGLHRSEAVYGGVTTTTLREKGLRDHPQTFPIQYHSKGLVA